MSATVLQEVRGIQKANALESKSSRIKLASWRLLIYIFFFTVVRILVSFTAGSRIVGTTHTSNASWRTGSANVHLVRQLQNQNGAPGPSMNIDCTTILTIASVVNIVPRLNPWQSET